LPDNLPSRIDRAAIERIIQRATELQTGERDLSEGLSPAEVVALGKDVGIPEQYLQQALLEERSRVVMVRPTGWLDRVIGPALISTARVVRGDPAEVEPRLLRWVEDNELFTVQRQQPGRISWERMGGMQAAIRRSSAAFQGNRPFMLSRATVLSASITGLEPGFSHVALAAEVGQARGGILGGVAAIASMGVAAGLILAVMSPFLWVAVVPVPFVLGVGWGIARQYRPMVERVHLGLERALDHLERGEIKPTHALPPRAGVVSAILDEVRRAIGGEKT
jgi:hypothetical protein